MKDMKKVLLFILFFITVSCSTNRKKYFDMVKGRWFIEQFYYKNEDLTLKRYDEIGFENFNHSWIITSETREGRFVSSDYEIFKHSDSLKLNIKNCEEKRFDGTYNMYIDTIQDTGESYIIQLILDKEDTYIQAVRSKLKYYSYGEYQESLKNKVKE
ncbi:hypothetical protein B8T70_21085 [Flavobacterium sp. AJR]|nr:hypothetical protein OA93_23835 [Flavobacterium sp. KMS]OUL60294.1 hypothetical protein B8T70_21085 [Flavobacterium sp. AJR]